MKSDLNERIDHLPVHVGIIMDGNGRWARLRNKNRTAGHQEGLKAAKRVVKKASELGIKFISLYTFSTENWKRTEEEVSFLMNLIKQSLKKEYQFYIDNQIRIVHSGDIYKLPDNVKKEIKNVMEKTKDFTGLILNIAINYGGRNEIVRAVNRILKSANGKGIHEITEEMLRSNLDLPFIPDPDLIIRTGGEKRISNFLLWECAYTEFIFSKKLWPDWQREDLEEAIREYARRERKYGGVH